VRRVWVSVAVALAMVVPAMSSAAPGRPPATWESLAPMSQARTEAAYALAGDEVYVVGGFVVAVTNSTSVEIYDTERNTWREGPAIPLAVNHGMATSWKGEVYHAGGYAVFLDGATNAFLHLDGGLWKPLAPMPETRAAGGMVAVGGRIYVVGGFSQQGTLAKTTLVYDVAAGTWSTAPPPPTPREHLTVVTDGRYVYAVGGRNGQPTTNMATVERLDTRTGRWTSLPPLLTKRSGHVSGITSNGLLVSAGGEYAGGVFDSVEAYDLRRGRRLRLPSLDPARTGFAAVAKGARFYVFSGAGDTGYLARTEYLVTLGYA